MFKTQLVMVSSTYRTALMAIRGMKSDNYIPIVRYDRHTQYFGGPDLIPTQQCCCFSNILCVSQACIVLIYGILLQL